jgi:pimeloyl-ACP methyl ester carboxylesterase
VEFHEDWGERCSRWDGVYSEYLDLHGTRVHVLRSDGPAERTGHLLVHGLGGAATNWLEVMPAIARLGPVVAPDLPGFGRTRPPRPGASRVDVNARFLRALMDHLGWERAVVHGNSMGGMLGILLGDLAPSRIEGLVLASPALPSPRAEVHRTSPRTLVRFAPFVFPGLGRVVLSRMWARTTPEQLWQETLEFVHADPGRVRPEFREVGLANVTFGRQQAWRVDGLASAAESLVARLVRSGRLWQAVRELEAPTLLLWGDQDRLVGRAVFEEARRRRPDWDHVVFEGAGHCPQIEIPERYVDAVASWIPHSARGLTA